MAPGGSKLSLEDTCEFKVPDLDIREKDAYLSLARACAANFGRNSFECLQPVSPGVYHITFRSIKLAKEACSKGLLFKNERFSVNPVGDNITVVTVKKAPYRMGDNAIASALLAFGEIKNISHVVIKDEEAGDFANGDRRVHIIMKAAIPNFIRVGSYTLMLTYRGVTKACRKCLSPDHIASDCKVSLVCDNCGRMGHVAALCGHGKTREGGQEEATSPATTRSFADVVRAPEYTVSGSEFPDAPSLPQPTDQQTDHLFDMAVNEQLLGNSTSVSTEDFPALPPLEDHPGDQLDTLTPESPDGTVEEFCDTLESPTPLEPLHRAFKCPKISSPRLILQKNQDISNVKFNKMNEKRPVSLFTDLEDSPTTEESDSNQGKEKRKKKRTRKEKTQLNKEDFLKGTAELKKQ